MILGLYYLMHDPLYIPEEQERKQRSFANTEEVLMALDASGSYNWFMRSGKGRTT